MDVKLDSKHLFGQSCKAILWVKPPKYANVLPTVNQSEQTFVGVRVGGGGVEESKLFISQDNKGLIHFFIWNDINVSEKNKETKTTEHVTWIHKYRYMYTNKILVLLSTIKKLYGL